MYYDIGAYDMKYDGFKEMCRVAWSEKPNNLCIGMSEKKNDCKYRILNENKNTFIIYVDCISETEPFH